ncbi:MAG: hypothetical protein KC609_20935 [Myxococcales bacterium]|nr:hypothetical protein [Myxococcales bacterium]
MLEPVKQTTGMAMNLSKPIGAVLLVVLLFSVQCGSSKSTNTTNDAQASDDASAGLDAGDGVLADDTGTTNDTVAKPDLAIEGDLGPDQQGPAHASDGQQPDLASPDTSQPDTSQPDTKVDPPDLAGGLYLQPTHPKILLNAEVKARLQKKLGDKTADALAFKQIVDTSVGGNPVYAFEWSMAALMYQLTGEDTYCDTAVLEVDAIVATAEKAIADGKIPEVAGDSYLYIGGTVSEIMLTYDWCFDKLTNSQKDRWFAYSNQAVWNVWNHQQATWGSTAAPWSGWSVDNPSNNYYYSFLRATMILGLATKGEKSEADTWLTKFRTEKLDNQLFPAFVKDLVGGGSREGTGYGVSMRGLFDLFAIWEASTNEPLFDKTPHPYESAFYLMHAVVPTLDRIAPIGDHARESTGLLFDYHREYMLVLTRFFRDTEVGELGAQWLSEISVDKMTQHFTKITEFLYFDPTIPKQPLTTLYPVYYGSGTGHVFMRSGWTKSATWANFIAGPYTESHAHQDQGSILIYKNEWLAYDQNIGSHSGIQQGTNVHNLVRLVRDGTTVTQKEGTSPGQLKALRDDATLTYVSGELAPVYDDSGITTVQRRMVFIKPNVFVVFDQIGSSATIDTVWQLNTPVAPSLSTRVATISGSSSTLRVEMLEPNSGSFETMNWTGQDDMTNGGYQLQFKQSGTSQHYVTVLSLDGALASATRLSETNILGATLTLADGRIVDVRFSTNSGTGSVIVKVGGNETYNQTFDESLQKLPRTTN